VYRPVRPEVSASAGSSRHEAKLAGAVINPDLIGRQPLKNYSMLFLDYLQNRKIT
jgi:hypothetical protein